MEPPALQRWAQAARRHRRLTLGVAALLVLLVAAGALRLDLDFSSRAFFGDGDRAADDLQEFVATWGPDDDALVVTAEVEDGSVWNPDRLQALDAVGRDLEGVAGVRGVRSIATILSPGPGSGPGPEIPPAVLATLASDDRLVPAWVSRSGRHAAIVVRLGRSSDDVQAIAPIVESVTARVRSHDGAEGLRFAVAGVPAIRAAFFRLTIADQSRFTPLVFVVIAIVLALTFRRRHAVLLPLVAAAVPTVGLVGIMGWTGEPLGLLNQALLTILPVIAIADAVHFVDRFHHERDAGHDAPSASARAIGRVGIACALTTATTAVGFASLSLADMPILARFGVYAAIGVGLSYVATVGILPALVSRGDRAAVPSPTLTAMLRTAASIGLRHPVLTLIVTAAVGAVTAFGASRVQVDNHLRGLIYPDHPVARASEQLDDELGGSLALQLDLTGPTGTFADPARRTQLAEFERWVRDQPEVRTTISVGTMGQVPAELARELVTDDHHRARVVIGMRDPGGARFEVLAARFAQRLRTDVGPNVAVIATGTPYVAYRGVNRITHDLRYSLALAVAAIAVAIAVLLRSVTMSLACLIPNLLPPAFGYAVLGFLDWRLDPLASVILIVGLTIAVDDTLHLVARIRENIRAGASIRDAIEGAVSTTGRAIVLTSITLALGLSINTLSSFAALRLLGFLGATLVIVAAVCDLIVLPALLTVIAGRGAQSDSA